MILTECEQVEARARCGANDILPGLTGWAQTNGRDAVTVEKKARLDGWWRGERGHVYQIPISDRAGQAGLLPVLLGEEETPGSDKVRLALGPSARKEGGDGSVFLPIGVILRISDWTAMRVRLWGPHRFRWQLGLQARGDVRLGCLRARARASNASI